MFGLQEILIITAIILGLLFIPRLTAKRQQPVVPKARLSGKMRMAIAASVIYLALIAAYLQPWQKNQAVFLYIGLGPVALGWLLCWVSMGFKKK
jgi:uncharacterized membrane protein